MKDTATTARALYGDGWHDLPRFVQDAAADLVGRTLSRWLADWRAANPQGVAR